MLPNKKIVKIKDKIFSYARQAVFFTDSTGRFLNDYLPPVLKAKEIIATSGIGTKTTFMGLTLVQFNLAIAYRDEELGADKVLHIKLKKRYHYGEK